MASVVHVMTRIWTRTLSPAMSHRSNFDIRCRVSFRAYPDERLPDMASNLLQQDIQIDRRLLAEVPAVGPQESLRGAAALLAQHAQEIPFGVELRRCAELGERLARDEMNAHLGPLASLGAPHVRHLPQQRDHAQLL